MVWILFNKGINRQLHKACKCGTILLHVPCGVHSILWTYLKGVHFANTGNHNHSKPDHILYISKIEQVQFEALINTNPTTGPLGLIVGVPGTNRPEESVTDISDIFLNAGQVGKEWLKVKAKSHHGEDKFIAAFAKFSADHPSFVIYLQLNAVTVISVQSTLMRHQMVKEWLLDEPINRLVSDAAHGWWKKQTSLLVVSSIYCPDLLCWAPRVLSYTNRASSDHFKYDFLGVIQSIAHEAELKKHPITDGLFAGVWIILNI